MFRRSKAPELFDSAAEPKVGRIRRVSRWWMSSTKTLITSAVFMMILVATGVYLAVFPAPDPVPTPVIASAPAETPALEPVAAAPAVPSAACVEQAAKPIPPETLVLTTYKTQWYPIGGMLAPQSKTGGPTDAVARQCFTRSPEGALYAVATRVATEAQGSGVAGRQFSGYQWLSYTPDFATVSLAAHAVGDSAEQVTARTFTATWLGTDWQVSVLQQPIEYLDGIRSFTIWGGA